MKKKLMQNKPNFTFNQMDSMKRKAYTTSELNLGEIR